MLIACFVARALFAIGTHAFHADDYWEYGKIARNLKQFGEYSFYSSAHGSLNEDFSVDEHKQPSAFMLPGYPLFLYPFLSIPDPTLQSACILCTQWLLATLCCWMLYQLCLQLFRWTDNARLIALIAASFYAASPDCVYAANSYTPTIFAHLSCVALAWMWISKSRPWQRYSVTFIATAVLISMRAEVLLFLAALTVLAWFGSQRALALTISLAVLSVLVPWAIRNSIVFSSPVLLSTTGGLNFYMGHNPDAILDRGDSALRYQINHLPNTSRLELQIDSIYKAKAWQTIRQEPARQAWLSVLKFFHLWIGNMGDPRARHPLALIPWLCSLILGFYGWWHLRKSSHPYNAPLYLWLAQYTFSSVLFFAIPRYQTMMKIAFLPLSAYGLYALYQHVIAARSSSR